LIYQAERDGVVRVAWGSRLLSGWRRVGMTRLKGRQVLSAGTAEVTSVGEDSSRFRMAVSFIGTVTAVHEPTFGRLPGVG